jgi:hypothetical protein
MTATATNLCGCTHTCRGTKNLPDGVRCWMAQPLPVSSAPASVACSARQMRAGSRALHAIMSHDHPLPRRIVNAGLDDLCWHDLMRFRDALDGALLAASIPDEPHGHLAEMREQFDRQATVLDPRD